MQTSGDYEPIRPGPDATSTKMVANPPGKRKHFNKRGNSKPKGKR